MDPFKWQESTNYVYYYMFLAYIPVLNTFTLVMLVRSIVFSFAYPYQNAIQKDTLDRFNNKRIAEELLHLMKNFTHTLKIRSDFPIDNVS